jgi:hypothetical protein
VKVEGLRVAQHLEVAAVDATLVDKLQIRISRNLEFLAIKIGFKLKKSEISIIKFQKLKSRIHLLCIFYLKVKTKQGQFETA